MGIGKETKEAGWKCQYSAGINCFNTNYKPVHPKLRCCGTCAWGYNKDDIFKMRIEKIRTELEGSNGEGT